MKSKKNDDSIEFVDESENRVVNPEQSSEEQFEQSLLPERLID